MRRIAMLLASAAVLCGALVGVALAADGEPGRRPPITIQVLSVSDWHGQLDPLVVNNVQVGGAAVLSSYFKADRAANPNTITLTAGDSFGATPPLANFFEERPAVLAMNAMGFSADGLGNHNWDRGNAHLQRMIDLAAFPYLSANLENLAGNLTGVKPYSIVDFGRVQVGVVGFTNPEAPTLVRPGAFGTITITDPVPAVERAAKRARSDGADVIVVMGHAGITNIDPSGTPSGPLVDIANRLRAKDVDLLLGDHTDVAFNGVINGIRVVENASKGATYAKTQLTVDQNNGKVLALASQTVTPLASAVTPDPAVEAVLAPFRSQLSGLLSVNVGSATRRIPRADACGQSAGRTCESLIGNVVTDALRARYGTDFAITNSGGLRADLTCPTTDLPTDFCPPFTPPPFPITAGQVITVLPFGNETATVTLTGAEVKAFLENGVSKMPGADGRFPQVSGLCFTYSISAAPGSRVTSIVRQSADGSCTGAAVDPSASYTVATNDFVAAGGDGYPNVIGRATTRALMDEDVREHVNAASPLSPQIQGRIVCTTTGTPACPVVTP